MCSRPCAQKNMSALICMLSMWVLTYVRSHAFICRAPIFVNICVLPFVGSRVRFSSPFTRCFGLTKIRCLGSLAGII